ncbi:MAG: hypothetical protein SGI74_03635 [Oligoflexia bacterium]|nr:hypothetical protein [Oligoflexia bacterium]
MTEKAKHEEPPKPQNSFRVTLVLNQSLSRLDQILMEELRKQDRNSELKNISRAKFKDLFKNNKIQIKGQTARPSSAISRGTTYVDILGFSDI